MILDSLNPAQREAVSSPLGHQLVLAGAGSGKTRVLTHRFVWLANKENISPYNLLAVTFTNKAASEMRGRIETLLNIPAKMLWIGTFHGISHRLLRAHYNEANLPQSFQILDQDDQQRMIRRSIQALNLDEERFPAKEAQWFINKQKEEGREPHQVTTRDYHETTQVSIYAAYQEATARSGVIDFTDLLLKSYRLLQTNESLRQFYQSKFRGILVDEFQDTNTIQYAWLKMLAGKDTSIMIVGDDDQSIYGWRGAKIENIHRFCQDFPETKTIRLEQNYRSTGTILKAANALIEKNKNRLGKNLWTEGQEGELITVFKAYNESDEAFFIANQIRACQKQNIPLKNIAILYRSNAQSRVLEEALMQFGLAYRVYGGLRYFDRQEIKDALAYLRLVTNRTDDAAFERIINTPTRGIGQATIHAIREHAQHEKITLWDASLQLIEKHVFAARAENALLAFINLINIMSNEMTDMPISKQVEIIIHQSDLMAHYKKEKGEKGLTRLENLNELVSAADQFMQEGVQDDLPPLAAFLAYASLESGEGKADAHEDSVQLMTLHAAKGLEFPVVFLGGCEEQLFPHYLSMNDPKALEEERRLCYVGMTRAMKKLFMSYAESRRMYGRESYNKPSRFLQDIPEELTTQVRKKSQVTHHASFSDTDSMSAPSTQPDSFQTGEIVSHRIFGKGTVVKSEGEGEMMKVHVKFKSVGTKILIASYLSPCVEA